MTARDLLVGASMLEASIDVIRVDLNRSGNASSAEEMICCPHFDFARSAISLAHSCLLEADGVSLR